MTLFSFFSPGSVSIEPGKKIIRAKELGTLLEASQILEKAKTDAEEYRKKVEQECENLKKRSEEEGLQKGLEAFNDKILALEEESKKMYLEMQKVLLPLALKAAKKIVGKELELRPETIVDIVLQSIAPVKQNKKIKIFVNKADLEAVEKAKPKLKEMFEQLQLLSVQERADVEPGGCIIETESGIINATTLDNLISQKKEK
jgi:type III secretion protein L